MATPDISPCAKCFMRGAQVSQEVCADQNEALSLFRKLFAQQIRPVLCRAEDLRFHVCFLAPGIRPHRSGPEAGNGIPQFIGGPAQLAG